MKLLTRLSVVTFISFLTIGCGGSDDDGGSKGGGIELGGGTTGGADNTGGNTGGATPQDIAGSWVSPCLRQRDGTTVKRAYGFDTTEGTPIYLRLTGLFNNGSCDGDPENTILLGGGATYNGTTPASVCTAHNFDVEYAYVKVNSNEYTGERLKKLLSDNNDNGTATGIVCALNGKVAINESDSNSNVRPNDVNQTFYYSKVTSKYVKETSLKNRLLDALKTQ